MTSSPPLNPLDAGVYDIVEYTHKDFFKSLGADIKIKKVMQEHGE